jgi:hypothetical protein
MWRRPNGFNNSVSKLVMLISAARREHYEVITGRHCSGDFELTARYVRRANHLRIPMNDLMWAFGPPSCNGRSFTLALRNPVHSRSARATSGDARAALP